MSLLSIFHKCICDLQKHAWCRSDISWLRVHLAYDTVYLSRSLVAADLGQVEEYIDLVRLPVLQIGAENAGAVKEGLWFMDWQLNSKPHVEQFICSAFYNDQ